MTTERKGTPNSHPEEWKTRVCEPPHPNPKAYATFHSNRGSPLLWYLSYPLHYYEWHRGGLIQSWKTKNTFGKCHSYSALVRRDGKIFGTPEDEGPTECTPWDHYATVTPSGFVDGISTDGYKFIAPREPISRK